MSSISYTEVPVRMLYNEYRCLVPASADALQYIAITGRTNGGVQTALVRQSVERCGGQGYTDAPPPTTTNRMMPSAQRLIGLRFESRSWREGLMGFLPARALSANWEFLLRNSNSVGCPGSEYSRQSRAGLGAKKPGRDRPW